MASSFLVLPAPQLTSTLGLLSDSIEWTQQVQVLHKDGTIVDFQDFVSYLASQVFLGRLVCAR
jgi:hypothetical protein